MNSKYKCFLLLGSLTLLFLSFGIQAAPAKIIRQKRQLFVNFEKSKSNKEVKATSEIKGPSEVKATSEIKSPSEVKATSEIKSPTFVTLLPSEKYLIRLQRSERILKAQSGRENESEPEVRASVYRSFENANWLSGLEFVEALRSTGSGNLVIDALRDELRVKGGYQSGLKSGVLWRAMLGVGGYQTKTMTKFAGQQTRTDYSNWSAVFEAEVEAACLYSNLEFNIGAGRTLWFGPQNLEGWVVFGGIGFWAF